MCLFCQIVSGEVEAEIVLDEGAAWWDFSTTVRCSRATRCS